MQKHKDAGILQLFLIHIQHFFQQCSQETYVGEQPFLWGLLPELLKGCVISQTFGFRESEQLVCYPYPGDDIIT